MAVIDAVIFDVDDTLIDDTVSWSRAVRGTCESLYHWGQLSDRISPVELAMSYRHVSDALWERFTEALAPLGSMAAIRRHVWAKALAERALNFSEPLLDRLVADYTRRRATEVHADPELRPLLRRLAKRHSLAVCSNGLRSEQVSKLRSTGLDGFFDVVVCGQDDGVFKPDPRLFLTCCKDLGVAPSRCLHIGDHWLKDVLGAWHAGLHPVWIGRTPPTPEPPVAWFPTTALAARAVLNNDIRLATPTIGSRS